MTRAGRIVLDGWGRARTEQVVATEARALAHYAEYRRCQISSSTKIVALRRDLKALLAADPQMHAVVMTQSRELHAAICTLVRSLNITVEDLSAGKFQDRHDAIRRFQAGCDRHTSSAEAKKTASAAAAAAASSSSSAAPSKPRVLVATLKIGNCGLTLTAASRVFLMEPCLDPAHEIQCAGRIHRLGQTKDVTVKRYAFKDSWESAVCALHQEVKEGKLEIVNAHLPAKAVKMLLQQ